MSSCSSIDGVETTVQPSQLDHHAPHQLFGAAATRTNAQPDTLQVLPGPEKRSVLRPRYDQRLRLLAGAL